MKNNMKTQDYTRKHKRGIPFVGLSIVIPNFVRQLKYSSTELKHGHDRTQKTYHGQWHFTLIDQSLQSSSELAETTEMLHVLR